MTTTIRTLKRSPTGRESIRERDYSGSVITIGRDVECDIQLEDLSVALLHAKLVKDNDGKVFLDINDGQVVSVDTRIRSGKTGPLSPGNVIKIGPYSFTLQPPPENSSLVILLEKGEALTETTETLSVEKTFTIHRSLPSKRFMAWTFSLAITILCLALPILSHQNPESVIAKDVPFQTDAFWNSGPVSLLHSNLQKDCKTCHIEGWTSVKDTTCLTCHESTGDHANPQDMAKSHPQVEGFDAALNQISEAFGRPVKRCSSCHVEHNTQAHIMPDDPHLCRDCHENLDQKLPQTKLSNVFDFGTSHPQFKPFIITKPDFEMPTIKRLSLDDDPKGFSGLKFPHDIHMSKTGAVAKMATTLETRYKFSGGVGCADCHRPEAGGALFEPVTMVQDCAMCHSIDFEDDNGYPRTLRHGEPQEVIASMKDFYDAKALANIRDAEMSTTTRRRPGQASQRRNLNRRELAFKQSEQRTLNKVNMIFSEGGSCYDCHVIDRPEDIKSLDFKVLPISVSDSFYTMSEFNHAAHEIGELTCQSCHSAETSQTSDDILLPKIDVCRDCHVSEEKFRAAEKLEEHAFPTNCLTCHVFHNAPHVKTIQGN